MPITNSRVRIALGAALAILPIVPEAIAQSAAPEALSIFFDTGRTRIRAQDEATLDQAARLFRDGNPIVMIVSGSTDNVGSASGNLRLSIERANMVVRELAARGIPVERLQVVGKGQSDPIVPAEGGEARNRRVDITWR